MNTQEALIRALLGHWIGVLEYRDYAEPAGSTKRVQLPTWLTIRTAPVGVFFDYTYDDGPKKTIFDHSAVVIDAGAQSYKVIGSDAVLESYAITGLEALRSGRGTLVLNGQGTDNKRPADMRITWTINRNLLSWLEEVRPAGSIEPFTFRHRYTFTRAEVPPVTP